MQTLRAALLLAGVLFGALLLGRWQGHRAAARDVASQLAAVNGARLADARRWARDSAAIDSAARVAQQRYARIAAERLDAQLVAARVQLTDARTVLADTAASASALRDALTETAHRLSLVTDMAESYRVRVDSLEAAHAAERALLARGLVYADSLAVHWQAEATRRRAGTAWYARAAETACLGLAATAGAVSGASLLDVKGAAGGALLGVAVGAMVCR